MAIFVMSAGKIFLAAAGLFSTANAAATLFTNGTIIAFENASNSLNIIRNGSVLVENDRITAVVPASYTGALPSDTEIINLAGDILSPGMVDTHRHTWQYVYKNLGTNMTFIDYLLRLGPTSRASDIFTPEDVYASEKMGLYEALHGGTTTVVSHSQVQWTEAHSDASIQASVDSGSRVFWSFAFTLSSALGQAVLTFEEHVALLRRQFERNIHRGTAVSIGFTYDTFNSAENTEETNAVVQLATELNISVLSTHSGLPHWGFSDNLPSNLNALGFLNQSIPILFVHASHISPTEAVLLRQHNQHISITPESGMHYGLDHPNSHLIQDQAALGTDIPWNFSGDILTQARLWLQTTRRSLYREVLNRWHVPTKNPMSANQAFLLATRNGGLALRRPDIGVIAVGAKADLVVWSSTSPAMLGWDDPVATIITHASVEDVKHVMVDGVIVKRDYVLVDEGYADLRRQYVSCANKIRDFFKGLPPPNLGEAHWNGLPYEESLQVDVLRGEATGYGPSFAS